MSNFKDELNINVILGMSLKDGVPCDHPGCLHHVTHPCEGCGRIAGFYPNERKNNMLKNLQKLVNELKETNSNNDKIEILAKYPECKNILFYVYHPLYQYNVTSKNLKKLKNIDCDYTESDDIFILLDYLRNRQITGHHAIKSVNWFIEKNKEYEDLIYNIIDKNLKCRINASTINKVWKNTIPEFKPALAYVYEDYENKVDFQKDNWFCSHKLNGCLDGNVLIEYKDGKKIPIKDVVENKIEGKIKVYNHKNNKIKYSKITNFFKNGDDINEKKYEWFLIKLENGKSIKLTGNHRVWLPELNCYRRVDELNGNEKFLID